MDGHLPDIIKEERANIIKNISEKKFKEFLLANIGREEEVLIEKRLDKGGKYKGITRNYLTVNLEEGEFNTLKRVRLEKLNNNRFIGIAL